MKRFVLPFAVVGYALMLQGCVVYPYPYSRSAGYYGYSPYYDFNYGYQTYGYSPYSYYGFEPYAYGTFGWGGSYYWGGPGYHHGGDSRWGRSRGWSRSGPSPGGRKGRSGGHGRH